MLYANALNKYKMKFDDYLIITSFFLIPLILSVVSILQAYEWLTMSFIALS